MAVRDLDTATEWYTALFGRGLDARPMDGLVEWHLTPQFGVQLWVDPENSGHCTVVLDESDLDAFIATLEPAGISHDGPQDASASRILQLSDPDGNRVVVTGAFR